MYSKVIYFRITPDTFRKINIHFASNYFPCVSNFFHVTAKFPVFSLSGKSKNQILCFPCAVATLLFLHRSVSHSVHRGGGVCLSACWDTQTHTPGKQTAHLESDTALRSACWEIWATSGSYASYWNAYLFLNVVTKNTNLLQIHFPIGKSKTSPHSHTKSHVHFYYFLSIYPLLRLFVTSFVKYSFLQTQHFSHNSCQSYLLCVRSSSSDMFTVSGSFFFFRLSFFIRCGLFLLHFSAFFGENDSLITAFSFSSGKLENTIIFCSRNTSQRTSRVLMFSYLVLGPSSLTFWPK